MELMRALRTPKTGCPWDLEQTFATIATYTIEEAYEVADAIARQDMDELKAELGDLLFQVVFHSRLAEEIGAFTLDDVINGIVEKMTRRHPHVFGTPDSRTATEQTQAWEAQKASERQSAGGTQRPTGALAGVALALPAAKRAQKLQNRAARVGFDWPTVGPIFDKLREEAGELEKALAQGSSTEQHEEVGDLLFVVVNLARKLNLDAETALADANRKFERRFERMEAIALAYGQIFDQLSLDEQEVIWQQAKRELKADAV